MLPVAGGTLQQRTASPGRRRAEKPRRSGPGPLPYLLAVGAGVILCVAAWVVLVLAAISFGHLAREGQLLAWAFTGGATVGAIGCLLLMFSLVARAQKRLAGVRVDRPKKVSVAPRDRPQPRRSSGGRRAAR